MRRSVFLMLAVVAIGGCSRHHHCRPRFADAYPDREPANLALGPTVETNRIAANLTERSDWPSIENGYRAEDTTFYYSDTYDAQYFFDRFGSYYRTDQSVRTGVRYR